MSIAFVVLSLIALKKEHKGATTIFLILSMAFVMSSPRWYIILDTNGDLNCALFFGLVTLLLVFLFTPQKFKLDNRGFVFFVAFLLWFSLFRGATRANELFDTSEEEIVNVKAVNVVDFGAGRGEFDYYFGYKNTEITCTVLNEDVIFTVPTISTQNLVCGDNIVVGVKNGFLGIKYCYVIFDENNKVAEQKPKKRTEGHYEFHLPGRRDYFFTH